MKKIVVNIFLSLSIILSALALVFCILTLQQLINSPDLYMHVIEYPLPYYLLQNDLIDLWKKYLVIILSINSILLLLLACFMVAYNFFTRSKTKEKNEQKKNDKIEKKIEHLQSKLKY